MSRKVTCVCGKRIVIPDSPSARFRCPGCGLVATFPELDRLRTSRTSHAPEPAAPVPETSPARARIQWHLWGTGAAFLLVGIIVLVVVLLNQEDHNPAPESPPPGGYSGILPPGGQPPFPAPRPQLPPPGPSTPATFKGIVKPVKGRPITELAALFPDNRRVVMAHGRGALVVRDIETGAELARSHGHRGMLHSLAVSPDGQHVLSGDGSGIVRLWMASSGIEKWRAYLTGAILAAHFTPDGKRALACPAGDLRAWDVETGKELSRLKKEQGKGDPALVKPSADGRHALVFRRFPVSLKLVALETGATLKEVPNSAGNGLSLSGMQLSPDSSLVAYWDEYGLKLWDFMGRSGPRLERAEQSSVNTVRFTPDGRRLFAGTSQKGVQVWDTETGKLLHALGGDGRSMLQVHSVSDDGKRALTGGWYHEPIVWDVETKKELHRLAPLPASFAALALARDASWLLYGDDWEMAWCFPNVSSSARSISWMSYAERPLCLAFSLDGSRALAGGDGEGWLYNTTNGNPVAKLLGIPGRMTAGGFTPDGKRIVTGSKKGTIHLWDTPAVPQEGLPHSQSPRLQLKEKRQLGEHDQGVTCLVISPDGRQVASGGEDRTVRLWDLDAGREKMIIKECKGPVRAIAYSPDGKLLLTSAGGFAQLWDAGSGVEVPIPGGSPAAGGVVAFTPDRSFFVADNSTGELLCHPVQAREGQAGGVPRLTGVAPLVVTFCPEKNMFGLVNKNTITELVIPDR